jgi:superfamily II DNA or RNA helicase
MVVLRPYQKTLYNDILTQLKTYNKVLAQADTGFGKSILIGHLANNLPGRTLILTHRIELLNQNSEWIDDLGILIAKVKKVQSVKECKNVISMAQTCIARFNKFGSDYIGHFDNVIVDEVHVNFFSKVYSQLNNSKLIAFTATPIINKKETKTINGIEYTRKLTLKEDYDVLCQGVSTLQLIELGFLTKDFNIQLTPPRLEELKSSESNPDGYTSKSLTEVFGTTASINTVFEGYNKYCIGKKTLIFNPTTKVNKEMFDFFTEKNVPVKMYDSVNKVKGQTRQQVTDWFQNTDDAVLLNVGVFTTGFSVDDLEVIIYNKKTKSLSLFLQSVGRGSRILKQHHIEAGKIKQHFLFLDMGLNISDHGKWSDKRDWEDYFKKNTWKLKREMDLLQMWECKQCGHFNTAGTFFNQELERIECDNCHEPKEDRKNKKFIKGSFVILEEPVYPQAKKLIEYVKRVGGQSSMVFNIAKAQILDLFIFHTDEEDYNQRKALYTQRISTLFRPIYFAVLNDKELTGKKRRLTTELEEIQTKVNKLYI